MRSNHKGFYSILIIVVLLCISVGYAAMNRTLNIIGSSKVEKNTWNVYFANPLVTNGSVSSDLPVIDINTKTTIDFSIILNFPGDFYEFTFDVVNDGTIDAMIDSILKLPELTEAQKKYINYIIEYQNGEQISLKHLLEKKSFVRIKVRVEYKKDILESELPTIEEVLNLRFALNYVQSDNTAVMVKNNGVIGANGDINEIGTIVTIGTEKFYTIGTEGDNVKLLAMYNLYIGGKYDNSWSAYGDEATGIQDSNMKGYILGQTLRKGTTKFSNSNYWSSTVSSYPAYVYNSNSILYSYVENYKIYLSTLGVTPSEARLITYEELVSLGCNGSSCNDAQSWVRSTTYWSGSASSPSDVWIVYGYGYFFYNYFTGSGTFGCRPVISISKSYF